MLPSAQENSGSLSLKPTSPASTRSLVCHHPTAPSIGWLPTVPGSFKGGRQQRSVSITLTGAPSTGSLFPFSLRCLHSWDPSSSQVGSPGRGLSPTHLYRKSQFMCSGAPTAIQVATTTVSLHRCLGSQRCGYRGPAGRGLVFSGARDTGRGPAQGCRAPADPPGLCHMSEDRGEVDHRARASRMSRPCASHLVPLAAVRPSPPFLFAASHRHAAHCSINTVGQCRASPHDAGGQPLGKPTTDAHCWGTNRGILTCPITKMSWCGDASEFSLVHESTLCCMGTSMPTGNCNHGRDAFWMARNS